MRKLLSPFEELLSGFKGKKKHVKRNEKMKIVKTKWVFFNWTVSSNSASEIS